MKKILLLKSKQRVLNNRRIILINKLVSNNREQTITKLIEKYPFVPNSTTEDIVDSVDKKMAEWVVKLTNDKKVRWPEDRTRLIQAWDFFNRAKSNQRFKELVDGYFRGTKHFKNILDFTLHELESLQDEVFPKKSKRQEKEDIKREGSEIVFDDKEHKILKIKTPEAACYYAKGTKWCTTDPEVARQYLDQSPLYIIFEGNQKVAQMHLTSGQIMDIKDHELDVNDLLADKIGKVIDKESTTSSIVDRFKILGWDRLSAEEEKKLTEALLNPELYYEVYGEYPEDYEQNIEEK